MEHQIKEASSKNEIFHLRTKVFNEITNKCNSHGDKRGFGNVNKIETLTSGETVFVKDKEETPNPEVSSNKPPQCSHCKNCDTLNIDTIVGFGIGINHIEIC